MGCCDTNTMAALLRLSIYTCTYITYKAACQGPINDSDTQSLSSLCLSITLLWHQHIYTLTRVAGFCFAVLCCSYTLTDFPISIRLTSLALWQSNDCPSASKATLMNMDKYFMWIHYERLHNHNKAKHNKTVCIFLGIYCTLGLMLLQD